MFKNYSTQLNLKEGLNKAKIKRGLFKYISGFQVLSLKDKTEIALDSRGNEVGLVLLEGRCDIGVDGKIYKGLGEREGVFAGYPTAAYIPMNKRFKIMGYNAKIALCYSKCNKDSDFAIINPKDIKIMQVGKDNWKREVRIIIGQNSPSVNMIVGETINPAGNWSGTPAHKHEKLNPPVESLHEELYYFKTDKPQGFGIERIYSYDKNINELIYLKENTVTFMPWGYHQIVAGPGYTLYYLFFLSGVGKDLIGLADSQHKWINE